jgi:hypothetical protein
MKSSNTHLKYVAYQARNHRFYAISTDRQQRMGGRYRGKSLIIDERRNAFVGSAGEILAFASAYDAEQWLERQWLASVGIAS